MIIVSSAALILLSILVWYFAFARVYREGLSDERGCRWDPVYNQMRCDV